MNNLLLCLLALVAIVYCICEEEVCDPCPAGYGRNEPSAVECCPACDIDCKVETAENPCERIEACEDGYYLDMPYGCCDMCVECDTTQCEAVSCENATVPEGECCEVCPHDDPCADFNYEDCPVTDCEEPFLPEGECCKECPQDDPCLDFNYDDCPPAECSSPFVPTGECCPACPADDPCRDFNYEDCPTLTCSATHVPEGECCEVCDEEEDPCEDFNYEDCPPVQCDEPFVPEGECCKECPQEDPCEDFNYEDCPPVQCDEPFVPEGKCCKECPQDDPCEDFNYEDCPPAECDEPFVPEGKCCKECPQDDPCEDFNYDDCPPAECDEPFVPEGECCKECPQDDPCEDFNYEDCPPVQCDEPFVPEGKCCKECPQDDPCEDFDPDTCHDDSTVSHEDDPCWYSYTSTSTCCPVWVELDCPRLSCTAENSYVPEGKCCPICRPVDTDCDNIVCGDVVCTDGVEPVVVGDECCPTCPLVDKCEDFDVTVCKTRDCYPGEKIAMRDCCPVCVRPCDTVSCPDYNCADGDLHFSSNDDCCDDSCVPTDCSNVLCYKPECGEKEELHIPEGECCPKCRRIDDRDCGEDIECGEIRCATGYVEAIPFGKCCPVCVRKSGYHISSSNTTVIVDEEKIKEILFTLFGDEISIADFEIVAVGDGKFFVQFSDEEQEAEFKSLLSSQTIYDSILVEDVMDDSDTDSAPGVAAFIAVVAIAALF